MSFDKLLGELEQLKKALPDVAAEGADTDPAAEGEGDEGEDEEGAAAEGGEVLGKSFAFTLEDGTVVEATDGTELVKSLMVRMNGQEGELRKALSDVTAVVTAQTELIKSLQAQVVALADQGRGRKSIVNVNEKPAAGELKKSVEGVTGPAFMAKAHQAFDGARITGIELAKCETYLNKGMQIPADLAAKVLG